MVFLRNKKLTFTTEFFSNRLYDKLLDADGKLEITA